MPALGGYGALATGKKWDASDQEPQADRQTDTVASPQLRTPRGVRQFAARDGTQVQFVKVAGARCGHRPAPLRARTSDRRYNPLKRAKYETQPRPLTLELAVS